MRRPGSAGFPAAEGADDPVTVTLGAAAQTINAAIVGTPRPRLVEVTARLKNATGANIEPDALLNGVGTDITQLTMDAVTGVAAPGVGSVRSFIVGPTGWCVLRFEMYIAPGSAPAERLAVGQAFARFTAGGDLVLTSFGIRFGNTATEISDVGFDSGVAGGFAAGSEISVKEVN